MASSAAETCAEVLLAGSRGVGGAEARARAVALAEEVGHATTRGDGCERSARERELGTVSVVGVRVRVEERRAREEERES